MVDNTGPANYDGGQTISMYPTAVYETTFYRKNDGTTIPDDIYVLGTTADGYSYGTVPAMLQSVSSSFQTIYDIWKNLTLSWIGPSADAAGELQAQLDKIQNRLFGTTATDGTYTPGVLEQMSSAASYAASVYSNVEETNTKMFTQFADDITWSPLPPEDDTSDSGNTSTPDTTDRLLGPITETFPK
jgi:hypothetical protein